MTTVLHAAPVCEKHGCEKRKVKDKRKKLGYTWGCPRCAVERTQRWQARNPERTKEIMDNWRFANPEKKKASEARWQKANPKRHAANASRWRKENPDQCCANSAKRRALRRDATDPSQPITTAVIAERLALFGGCAYCGKDKKLEIEHVVALSDGGLHVPSNLVGACRSCNSSKNDKPVEEWFKSQPFFSVERFQRLNGLTCA